MPNNVVIDKQAKPMTPELLIRVLFGVSMDQFINDVKCGKYANITAKSEKREVTVNENHI